MRRAAGRTLTALFLAPALSACGPVVIKSEEHRPTGATEVVPNDSRGEETDFTPAAPAEAKEMQRVSDEFLHALAKGNFDGACKLVAGPEGKLAKDDGFTMSECKAEFEVEFSRAPGEKVATAKDVYLLMGTEHARKNGRWGSTYSAVARGHKVMRFPMLQIDGSWYVHLMERAQFAPTAPLPTLRVPEAAPTRTPAAAADRTGVETVGNALVAAGYKGDVRGLCKTMTVSGGSRPVSDDPAAMAACERQFKGAVAQDASEAETEPPTWDGIEVAGDTAYAWSGDTTFTKERPLVLRRVQGGWYTDPLCTERES